MDELKEEFKKENEELVEFHKLILPKSEDDHLPPISRSTPNLLPSDADSWSDLLERTKDLIQVKQKNSWIAADLMNRRWN